MKWRRWLALSGLIAIAAALAFPMRGTVYQLIVIPLSYILWLLNLLYLSLSQGIWWLLVALIVLFILGYSLLPEIKSTRKTIPYERRERGQVESLAAAIRKSDRGVYFKWLVANRLGKLAYQILLQREHGKPRSVFAPLTSDGWNPPDEVQGYLEKGLHGSFAEFPNHTWASFTPPQKTPLDQDVQEVVEFLESTQSDSHVPAR